MVGASGMTTNICYLSLALGWLLLIGQVSADEAADAATAINAANQLLRDGEVEQALSQYQAIASPGGSRNALLYNQAVALYRKGDVDSAAKLFEEVAGSGDTKLAAPSRYNLGNCRYSQGLELAESDPQAAIAQLSDAIQHYRGSLRSAPANNDARVNVELAAKLIDELNQTPDEEPEQPNNSGSEDQPSGDSQDSDSEPSKSDSKEGDSQPEQQEEPGAEDGSGEPKQPEQQRSGQQASAGEANQNDDSESQSGKPEDKASNGEEESKPSDGGEAEDSQAKQPSKQNTEPSDLGGKDESSSEEKESAEESTSPLQTPTGELTSENANEKQVESVGTETTDQVGLMDQQEAMKMLQAIRDRDMLRRFQLQQRERRRYVPVDRDW
jgi:Ca-activated chloride channel homolog